MNDSMESVDIWNLKKAIKSLGRPDLAGLLDNAKSDLKESDTYGSRLFSRLSEFEIYCSPKNYAKLTSLSPADDEIIRNAVHLIYPTRDNEPEVYKVSYLIDFDNEEEDDCDVALVESNHLNDISFDYVHEQLRKCHEKIRNSDFEGAVTNARTLLESVCLYIVEELTRNPYQHDGNLAKLHKSVADLLKMNANDYDSQNLKRILTGVSSIVHGVAELRNAQSDAHGKSPSQQTFRIDERHAIFVVNLARSVSEYLFLSFIKAQQAKTYKSESSSETQ